MRILSWLAGLIGAGIALAAVAQTANPYMLPTAITAAGTYPQNLSGTAVPIPVGSPNTAIVALEATGSGTGLSFKLQGIPIGSSTAQDLLLFTAPNCAASATSQTANGVYFANVSGFSKVQLVVATITGTETFGITNSMQPNCASVAPPNLSTPAPFTPTPSSSASVGNTLVVSSAAESSHVLKNAPGNFYGLQTTTGASAGYVMVFDATSSPADGTVTPKLCAQVDANKTVSISGSAGIPLVFATGITAVFSTTGCFTKTASATAFFAGSVK